MNIRLIKFKLFMFQLKTYDDTLAWWHMTTRLLDPAASGGAYQGRQSQWQVKYNG
jgi:hypothetical protein